MQGRFFVRKNEGLSIDQLKKILNDDSYVVGYCENHEEPIDQGRFEYVGCWTCCDHFRWDNWPYINAKEARKLRSVCKNGL